MFSKHGLILATIATNLLAILTPAWVVTRERSTGLFRTCLDAKCFFIIPSLIPVFAKVVTLLLSIAAGFQFISLMMHLATKHKRWESLGNVLLFVSGLCMVMSCATFTFQILLGTPRGVVFPFGYSFSLAWTSTFLNFWSLAPRNDEIRKT